MGEMITIGVSKYLSQAHASALALAQWNNNAAPWVNAVRLSLFDVEDTGAYFDVIATNENGTLVGRLHCLQNTHDRKLWYYGDLFVLPEYRRKYIATRLVNAAKTHISEQGGLRLRCYVEPNHEASLMLQRSLGFEQKAFAPFDCLQNEGQIMFECNVPCLLNAIRATEHEAYFVCLLYAQNRDALHTEPICMQVWKELLAQKDPDEAHFLICKGALPVAYLKINGLSGSEAWISMLFVAPTHQRMGVGAYAVRFAWDFVLEKGFTRLFVQTTQDNTAAQSLYRFCGFSECGRDAEKVRFQID